MQKHHEHNETARFDQKIAIVTGSGSGIGRATCLRLAHEGARVAIVDIDRTMGCETLALVEKAGGQGIFLQADVAESSDVQGVINRTVEVWKRLDILVNNAGTMRFQPAMSLPEDDWDRVIAVNLRSAFLFSKYALPHMKKPSGSQRRRDYQHFQRPRARHHAQFDGVCRFQRRSGSVHARAEFGNRSHERARQCRRARRGRYAAVVDKSESAIGRRKARRQSDFRRCYRRCNLLFSLVRSCLCFRHHADRRCRTFGAFVRPKACCKYLQHNRIQKMALQVLAAPFSFSNSQHPI